MYGFDQSRKQIFFSHLINIDFHIIPFISTRARDAMWTRANKGYDIKNDMLWFDYLILQQRK